MSAGIELGVYMSAEYLWASCGDHYEYRRDLVSCWSLLKCTLVFNIRMEIALMYARISVGLACSAVWGVIKYICVCVLRTVNTLQYL